MISYSLKTVVIVLTTSLTTACVSVSPRERDARVNALIKASGAPTSDVATAYDQAAVDARTHELLAAPLTSRAAIELSFLNNPRVASEFARLSITQSELVAASRLQNPVLSASRTDGGGSHITIFAFTQNLANLIFLAPRKQFAAAEYERAQQTAAASIIDLSADVEQAWYRYVGSEQIAAMRAVIATSAETSSLLAERFYSAGNISELDLALERSAAAQARIGATRAAAEAVRTKFALQQLMGLTGEPSWSATLLLPTPIAATDELDSLLATAYARRGDLAAARQEVALLGDALTLAKRWRWLGSVDVGVERDREQDGARLTGPTLALALPIFDHGQAGIARAEAQLAGARARLIALETDVGNSVRFNHARVDAARVIATQFVTLLNPAQQIIVERQQERENFMFVGQFELLLAKQQQYDAYQSYLEAVRDYWLARSDLARATGGSLPSDAQIPPASIGVETVIQPADESMGGMPGMEDMDDGTHGSHGDATAHPNTDAPANKPSDPDVPNMKPSGTGEHR